MTSAILSIVLANLAYACIGFGTAAAAGVFERRRASVGVLLGLPLGIAVVLLTAAYASILGVALTPTVVTSLAVLALGVGGWRLRRRAHKPTASRRSPLEFAAALVPAVAIVWVLVHAARTATVKPLLEWDGWVLWATKARVLFEHPVEGAGVLQSDFYGAPSYPLGLPALEATTMRAVGSFDGTLLDLQLVALVAAAVVGVWALLRGSAHPVTTALALLATLASPTIAHQVTSNYADVPLAFLTALAVVAGAVWLTHAEGEAWQLVCFVVFLAAAAWTKSEGLLFAGVAVAMLVALALATSRPWRAPVLAAAAWVALVAPWRVYAAANDLQTADYDLRDFTDLALLRDRADRLLPAAEELLAQMASVEGWGASLAVVVLAVATASLSGRRLVGAFAAGWLVLSFAGLVGTYWISNHSLEGNLGNSSNRVILALLVSGLCLVPLLVDEPVSRGVAALRARWPVARRSDDGREGLR